MTVRADVLSAATRRSCVRARRSIDFGPQRIEVEHEPSAAGDAHAAVSGAERHGIAAVAAELVHLETAELGVEDKIVAHAGPGVVAEFLYAVAANVTRAGRSDLDGEVGRDADERVSDGAGRDGGRNTARSGFRPRRGPTAWCDTVGGPARSERTTSIK